MKRNIFTLFISLLAFAGFSQETPPPMDANFMQLSTSTFYIHLPDSVIWQYKGSTYGWARIARYKDVKVAIDGLLLKEDSSNKQNSLDKDGTGVKYPTVDAVNESLGFVQYNTQYYPSTNNYYAEQSILNTTNHNRDGAKLAVLGEYLFSMGGWHPDSVPHTDSEIYRFNRTVTATTRLSDAPWAGRHTFGSAYVKDTVFVFGGDLIAGPYQKDSWKGVLQSDSTISWTLLNNNVPWGERILFGSTYHNGYLYVIGGQKTALASDGLLDDVWRSKDGISWVKIADGLTQFGKNIVGNAVSYAGYIYIIGGGIYDSPTTNGTFGNEVWRSKDGISWEQLPDAPWAGRQYNDCVVYDGKIFTIGGNTGGNPAADNTNDVWSLDANGFWMKIDVGMHARHATAVGAYNNMLVMSTGNYWNDTWILNKYNSSSISGVPNTIVARDRNGFINNDIFNAVSGGSGGYVIGSTGSNPNGDASLFYNADVLRLGSKLDMGFYPGNTITPSIYLTEVGQVRFPSLSNGAVKIDGGNGTLLNAVDGVDYYNPTTYPLKPGGETWESVLARNPTSTRSTFVSGALGGPPAGIAVYQYVTGGMGFIGSYNYAGAGSVVNTVINGDGGLVGIGKTPSNAALDVNGKIKASAAPTNPTDVVRLTDLGPYATTSSLSSYELLSNKSTSTSLGTSNTLYPTQNATKVYADTKLPLAGGTLTGNLTLTKNTPLILLNGTQASGRNYSISSGITGVSNTGFAIRDDSNGVNLFYLNSAGDAIFAGYTINANAPTLGSHLTNKTYVDGLNASTVKTTGNQTGIAGNKSWTGTHTFAGVTKVTVVEYADNAAAITAGLAVGSIYRTGDLLKVVH